MHYTWIGGKRETWFKGSLKTQVWEQSLFSVYAKLLFLIVRTDGSDRWTNSAKDFMQKTKWRKNLLWFLKQVARNLTKDDKDVFFSIMKVAAKVKTLTVPDFWFSSLISRKQVAKLRTHN